MGRIAIHAGVDTSIDAHAARATVRFLRAIRGLLRGTRVCAVALVASTRAGVCVDGECQTSVAAMTHVADARVDVESLPGAPCALEQTLPDPLLCVGLVHAVKIALTWRRAEQGIGREHAEESLRTLFYTRKIWPVGNQKTDLSSTSQSVLYTMVVVVGII